MKGTANGNGLIVRVPLYDDAGNRIGETEAATFKGLLCLAHGEGLRSARTRLIQAPTQANSMTTIVQAFVRTNRGRFSALGDANRENTETQFAVHGIRIAETRALARAFRLAVNIGEVALDELGRGVTGAVVPKGTNGNGPPLDESDTGHDATNSGSDGAVHGETSQPRGARPWRAASEAEPSNGTGRANHHGRDDHPEAAAPDDCRAMSDAQRRLLVRLAFSLGESKETATARVKRALGLERLEWATRADASRAIDDLKHELEERDAIQGGNGEARHDA